MVEETPLILVLVEDDDGVASVFEMLLKSYLSDLNFFIIRGRTMNEVAQMLNSLLPPDVIIWDGVILDGTTTDKLVDGKSLIEHACKRFPGCLMIALSGTPDIAVKQVEQGCTVKIGKPMNTPFLIEALRSLARSTGLTEQDMPKIQAVA